jgi:hypothetical protein
MCQEGDGPVFDKKDIRALINDIFEQLGLLIGGLVAVHKVDDDLVWRLIRNIDAIRRKFLRRLEETDPDDEGGGAQRRLNLTPHPAIEEFLLSVRRG